MLVTRLPPATGKSRTSLPVSTVGRLIDPVYLGGAGGGKRPDGLPWPARLNASTTPATAASATTVSAATPTRDRLPVSSSSSTPSSTPRPGVTYRGWQIAAPAVDVLLPARLPRSLRLSARQGLEACDAVVPERPRELRRRGLLQHMRQPHIRRPRSSELPTAPWVLPGTGSVPAAGK